ncbi:acyl-CoA N-acyltransferase [Flagelloscypha sp. PMI_526]|nr:acyl-CoA N-acyltransferase [Flagelloscypha sp. PMI_526]
MFETSRLRLRPYTDATDKALFFELCNTAAVSSTWFSGDFSPRTEKAVTRTVDKLTGGPFHAIIELREPAFPSQSTSERFVGFVAIHSVETRNRYGQFVIALSPSAWGKGYALEASKFVVGHAFLHLGLNRLQLEVFDDNEKALKLYKKSGFEVEGHREETRWVNGGWVGETLMGLLARKWFAENPLKVT